jgi:hypothetical protein
MSVFDENTKEFWEGTMTVTDELGTKITKEVLPNLEKVFSGLLGLQQVWIVNDVEDKIQDAIDNTTTLSGYAPEAWYMWGETLRLMMVWINTPQETLMGKTPLQVILKRYEKV